MENPTSAPQCPQKRPHEDDTTQAVTTPSRPPRSEASTPLSVLSVPTPPSLNVSRSENAPSSSITAPSSSSAQQPAKRRKLTQKEKDDARTEKEAKAKAREEKKALKEAEDKAKAEQKALKEEERRLRDEEKQKKVGEREDKKRQREEEEAKKQRSQMKLGAFFAKPKIAGVSPGKVSVESTQPLATAVLSLSTLPKSLSTTAIAVSSPQRNIVANAKSDYDRYFLPFSLPAHTILAPINALMIDLARLDAARLRLDSLIAERDATTQPASSTDLQSYFPRSDRGVATRTIAEVVESVNSSSDRPIDLTGDKATCTLRPQDVLNDIPMKYIHFGEDVRPPYYGTHTQSYTLLQASHLARNPHSRTRKDTNYDYDSEAEWDEPEEGEDLDSEDDEDGAEDAEDDMDGFLDDEEDSQMKRRQISGDLRPISTGLCWQDSEGLSRLNDGSGAICTDFRAFEIGFLLDHQITSIDPFTTNYWTPEPAIAAQTAIIAATSGLNSSMNPPRAPLAQRTMNGLLNTLNTPAKASITAASKGTKAKRMIPPEQLPAFKAEIDGKDLTKIGMVEALKKVFPKLPKDAITNTLSVVAARVGPTEKEKRWVLINA